MVGVIEGRLYGWSFGASKIMMVDPKTSTAAGLWHKIAHKLVQQIDNYSSKYKTANFNDSCYNWDSGGRYLQKRKKNSS